MKNDSKKVRHVYQMEELIDGLEKELNFFIADLSQHSLTHSQSLMVSKLMTVTNDIERIGDHAENIIQLAETKIEERLPYSEEAINQLEELYEKVDHMLKYSITAFDTENTDLARRVIKEDDEVDCMEKKLRQKHIKRINEKKCHPLSGVLFLDVLSNLERIADHATNVAEATTGEF